jgi:hypothetical protein
MENGAEFEILNETGLYPIRSINIKDRESTACGLRVRLRLVVLDAYNGSDPGIDVVVMDLPPLSSPR